MSDLTNQIQSIMRNVPSLEPKQEMKFKKDNDFEKRRREATKIKTKYPDRIPIICEQSLSSTQIPSLDKTKFLVPRDLSVGQFLFVIRRRIQLSPEKALYLFVGRKIMAPTSEIIDGLYERYRDPDGFLYMTYSGENCFGSK